VPATPQADPVSSPHRINRAASSVESNPPGPNYNYNRDYLNELWRSRLNVFGPDNVAGSPQGIAA
jgi:hypothetical protein